MSGTMRRGMGLRDPPSTPPHRKRMRRHETPNQPRFVTFSCYQRLPLLKTDPLKRAFIEILEQVRTETELRVIGWVIMPEHVHMVIVPRGGPRTVSAALREIKRRFAERVLGRWKRLQAPVLRRIAVAPGRHRFWQHGGGYDRNVRDEHELWEKVNYMHNNPVSRGLAVTPTDYPWSSARWYAGDRDSSVIAIDSP